MPSFCAAPRALPTHPTRMQFMLECLLKLELEGIAKYTLNMFVPRVCADGTIYHADGSRTLGDGTVILPDGTKVRSH